MSNPLRICRAGFLVVWLIAGRLLAQAASGNAPPIPTFYGTNLTDVTAVYRLALSPNRPDVSGWSIDWGDGKQSVEAATKTGSEHLYEKPGRYLVQVTAQLSDATSIAASRDYGRLLQVDCPSAATDFPSAKAEASPATLRFLAARLANQPLTGTPTVLKTGFAEPVDQFSVEFWLRPNDLNPRQELLDADGVTGKPTRLYLENSALQLGLAGSDTFIQPVARQLHPGRWSHVAVTYDRAQTFPFSNIARFYLDGALIGEQHLDKYDTGPVDLPTASIGSAPDGSYALNGSIAELAVYDRWLNPAHLPARVDCGSGGQGVVVAPKNAESFTVDQPRITTTLDVALNPDQTADNGPALRAAIEHAQPGTRIRVLNTATGQPGGRFYFSSLAGGHDWTALRVMDKTDFELDGGGADFVFRTDVRQLSVKHCTRAAFRRFNIDLDQDKYRVACYAKILDVDATAGTVRFQFVNGRTDAPDRAVPSSVSLWRWRSLDPRTLRILGKNGIFFHTGDVFGAPLARDPADPSILIGHPTNAKMLDAFEKYRRGANFLMVNNARFENTSASVWDRCSHITFDRVNFYATLGMVFLSSDFDHLWVTHCRIGLPPGLTAADRPLASGADGYHFHESLGHVLFENNEITLTDDDPISIKDGIWRNLSASGPSMIQMDGCHVGEEIELYKNDLSPLHYTALVTAATRNTVTLDTPLPANLPETFLGQNHRQRTFNWVLKDSYFHDFYGRFLLYTPWGRISGNEITRSYLHLGTAAASFDDGGISSNVLVDNNILIDTNGDTGLWGIDSSYPVFQNITFAANAFLGRGLTLRNTGNALVADNYFEIPSSSQAIDIHSSIDPQLIGNQPTGISIKVAGSGQAATSGAELK